MALTDQINEDLKAAMLARDEVRKLTLRGIKKEILEARTAPGFSGELDDQALMKILSKMLKQRKDSAAIYEQQNRPELAANELAEAVIIQSYLPKALSPEELEAALNEIIKQAAAKGPADMGKVMGMASKALSGKAEGRQISETVKRLLSSM
ncbi:MAG: GatB/YqeY domain-containing protein [Bacteroidales bacterium]|nr:GatB/YqeY domain-containing protein [Bacteroidales bacterium]